MKASFFSYLFAALLLSAFYAFFVPTGALRLSVYYAPDGTLIPIHKNTDPSADKYRITEINGQRPDQHPAVFFHSLQARVLTEPSSQDIETVANNFYKILSDFKYFIIASFLFLFCAIWFYHNTRDIHLIVLNIVISIFYASFVILLAQHKLLFLFQLSVLLLIPTFLNMGLRTTGRHISSYLAIAELNFILFVSLLAYVGANNPKTIAALNLFIVTLSAFVILLALVLQFQRCLQKASDSIENLKHWVLFTGLLLGVFLPLALAMLGFMGLIALFPFEYLVLMNLFFPIALLYGTYHLQLMPFQILFSKSVLFFLQSAFFICIYGIAIPIQNMLLSPQEMEGYEWIVHLVFILTLILFLDPIKYFFSSWLAKIHLWGEDRLEASLRKMFSLITSDRRIQAASDTLLEGVKETLKLEKVDLLLSENTFPDLKLRKNKLIRLESKNPIWMRLQEYNFVVTDYLTYGGGTRKELFHFLLQNNYVLAIGVKGLKYYKYKFPFPLFTKKREPKGEALAFSDMKAALLIGYSKQRANLKISETRYLHEAASLMNILIRNYAILIAEIEKRRRIRELQVAGQIQRKIPEMGREEFPGIRFSHSIQPALSVSGDYFDIIPLKNNQLACFLGDVSGHGLGTGYLASSLRAIVRSHLEGGVKLNQTVQTVNRFLMERYQGDEFLTLVALLLNTKTGDLEYINAAHPGPYLFKAKKAELTQLKSFQPVIGVLPVSYSSQKIKMNVGDRLFLYSDGVTETFDRHNVAFGEENLENFLEEHKTLALQEVIEGLQKRLLTFRENKSPNDDTSMAILELSTKPTLFDNVLNLAHKRLLKFIKQEHS